MQTLHRARTIVAAALCALSSPLAAMAGDNSATCTGATHSCYERGAPGCNDSACCEQVCALDPYCCNAEWDVSCVNRAIVVCGFPACDWACPPGATAEGEPCGTQINGGCELPINGDSSCCRSNPTGSCDDGTCAAAVCADWSNCCEYEWDQFCAQLALRYCPDLCTLGAPAFTPINCGQTICGTIWAENGQHDNDWFEFTLTETRRVTITVSSKLDLRFGIANNHGIPDCGGSLQLSPFNFTGICSTATVEACLVAGTYWIQVAPTAYDGFSCESGLNDYYINLTCGEACIPPTCGSPEAGSCFEADGAPYCADAACCAVVCEVNPYCCDVAWDSSCVAEAKTYCVSCDLPVVPGEVHEKEPCGEDTNGGCNLPQLGTSSCCHPGSAPGCDNGDCQQLVCEYDAYCCEVMWDSFCSSIAPLLCTELCPLGAPAFEPIACGMTIRGTAWAENGLKDTDWYELRVEQRTTITFKGTAQFPLMIGLSDTGGIGGCVYGTGWSQLNPYVLANPCNEATFTTCIEPGTWYLFVAPQITFNWPCVDSSCHCPDLNNDGVVDGTDLGVLLGDWGPGESCANLDGVPGVDGVDLGILLGAWGPYHCTSTGKNEYVVNLQCGGVCTSEVSNDTCAEASPIGVGTTEFSTVGATSGGPVLPKWCDEFGLIFVRDVWFEFTAPSTGLLLVSTCDQANFDTRLAVYTGACGALEIVGCNDEDEACLMHTSQLYVVVEEGVKYKIRVGSYADWGSGTLSVTYP